MTIPCVRAPLPSSQIHYFCLFIIIVIFRQLCHSLRLVSYGCETTVSLQEWTPISQLFCTHRDDSQLTCFFYRLTIHLSPIKYPVDCQVRIVFASILAITSQYADSASFLFKYKIANSTTSSNYTL